MQQFVYRIKDPYGIHARPAGLLAKRAKDFPDTVIEVFRDGESARAGQLMKLMSLGVKQGTEVTVTAEGPSEEKAIAAMKRFFSENL